MPGVAGLHVMPLGKGARRLASQILVQEASRGPFAMTEGALK